MKLIEVFEVSSITGEQIEQFKADFDFYLGKERIVKTMVNNKISDMTKEANILVAEYDNGEKLVLAETNFNFGFCDCCTDDIDGNLIKLTSYKFQP